MSGKSFVDTNILVYARDTSAGAKHARAKQLTETLWNERSGVISTQVLQELCVNLRRKVAKPLAWQELRDIIADYAAWHVVNNTPDSVLQSLEIEARYRISFWDALIVQAAEASGAAILYSEDLSHGQLYAGVRVINPFLAA